MEDGFKNGISNDAYHSNRTHVSSSGIKLMYRNPREYYKQYVLNDKTNAPKGPALIIGSYVHCALLEPHKLDIEFAVFEGAMKRGKAWEEFKALNEGKDILNSTQAREANKLITSFNEATVNLGDIKSPTDVAVSSFFQDGFPEQALFGELDTTPVKVMFDYRKEFEDFGNIIDIKTTKYSVSKKETIEAACAERDYDLSAALYVDLVEKVTGKVHDFTFCFISKESGDTRLFKASEQMLEKGREKYKEGLRLLRIAKKTGIYYRNVIEEINSI